MLRPGVSKQKCMTLYLSHSRLLVTLYLALFSVPQWPVTRFTSIVWCGHRRVYSQCPLKPVSAHDKPHIKYFDYHYFQCFWGLLWYLQELFTENIILTFTWKIRSICYLSHDVSILILAIPSFGCRWWLRPWN